MSNRQRSFFDQSHNAKVCLFSCYSLAVVDANKLLAIRRDPTGTGTKALLIFLETEIHLNGLWKGLRFLCRHRQSLN
jgi:hypothetical protein